jgi:Ca2+-binding EF-hand superfamily protein
MQKMGLEVPKEEIESIMMKHDVKKDGIISFEEFKLIFEEKTD